MFKVNLKTSVISQFFELPIMACTYCGMHSWQTGKLILIKIKK